MGKSYGRRERERLACEKRYFLAWSALEKNDLVDAWDGAECQRVKAAWFTAGSPLAVSAFILTWANQPAPEDKR